MKFLTKKVSNLDTVVLGKSRIHHYFNENGPGVRAELKLELEEGRSIPAVMFNKVVDDQYEDLLVGKPATIKNFTYRPESRDLVIDLEKDPDEVVEFEVTSIRDYPTGQDHPAVLFKDESRGNFSFEYKTYNWKQSAMELKFANAQYFPNDLSEIVLDVAGKIEPIEETTEFSE